VKNACVMRVSSRSPGGHGKRDDTLSVREPAFQDDHASTLVTQKKFLQTEIFRQSRRRRPETDTFNHYRPSLPNQAKERDAGKGILKGMRHHPGTQALAEIRQNSKEHAVNSDHKHHARALICMRQTEDGSGQKNSKEGIFRESDKLALEVS